MTFANPWALVLAAPALLWALRERRVSGRPLGTALKAAAFAMIVLALAEPRLVRRETGLALALLADESGSVPPADRARTRGLAEELRRVGGTATVREIGFASAPRRASEPDSAAATRLGATNLEAAVRAGLTVLPPDRVGRLALVSDGLETEGSVERALYQARELGVPIDVFPLAGRARPKLGLLGISTPDRAYVGERMEIELIVESPADVTATLTLSAEGASLGSSEARLRAGLNRVRARVRLDIPGAALIEGELRAEGLGALSFARVARLETPRALLIGNAAGGGRHLAAALRAAEFAIETTDRPPGAAAPLRETYELIVVENQDFESWPLEVKRNLETFVAQGGGFLMVAGENNLYVERDEESLDPLNRMLPATLAPPRAPEGAAVVLVLDKSSSMEGKKMQLARQSAMGMVDNLRPIDFVGVLVFDNSHEWAVPLRRNDDPAGIKRLIGGVIADGGTQIAPALREAYEMILPRETVYKHILLLTDGISEEGDSLELAREAARRKVTISTIGLGQDVNRSYLERVAQQAGGRSYMVIDVSQLARIVLRDVLEHMGTSLAELEFYPRVERRSEIIEGIDFRQAGPLLGWVRYEAKPTAETLLGVDDENPLFVRRQHGLGRAAVFASDARDRWAANWIAWDGFDRFWSNVFRDLLPRSPIVEVETRLDPASEEIVVVYRGRGASLEPPDEILAAGPDGYRAALPVERVAPGVFEIRAAIGARRGMFRFRPADARSEFPEAGFHRENLERLSFGSNPALLRTIAESTGGLYDPQPAAVFAADGRSRRVEWEPRPWLLAAALLLNLIELLDRKGRLPRRRRSS